MSGQIASMSEAPSAGSRTGAFYVFSAAALASLGAAATGLWLVFGQGMFEDPARAFIVAGLVYGALPGIPALLAIRWLFSASPAGGLRDLAGYVALSALAALIWMLPFLGLYVPADSANTLAAAGEMATFHGLSGGAGGLLFWLLTRSRRVTS